MAIATIETIKRNDPVREAFSSCSSGHVPGAYYDTKGHALRAFDAALADFGYHLDCEAALADWAGDAGRNLVDVYVEDGDCVGYAVLYYFRMPSGRYEFVAYIA
jgi:hypothetical protein